MRGVLLTIALAINYFSLFYVLVISSIYFIQLVSAAAGLRKYTRSLRYTDYERFVDSSNMCSKGLGADLVYALPTASIAVLGADSAVDILYRKELKTALDPVRRAEELKAGYEQEFSNPYRAAKEGFVSDIVEANQLRSRLIFDYSVLSARQRTAAEHTPHGNIPL